MTTQVRGWSEFHEEGYQAGWAAWRRFGIELYDHIGNASRLDREPQMVPLARQIVEAIVEPALAVLDRVDLELKLDRDAQARYLEAIALGLVHNFMFQVSSSIGDEWARANVELVPFDPPQTGQWIRSRRRDGDEEPEWRGAWHVFNGDLDPRNSRTGGMDGHTRCGRRMTLLLASMSGAGGWDTVAVDDLPGVDVCKSCARASEARS
jgi:hypothetical protein